MLWKDRLRQGSAGVKIRAHAENAENAEEDWRIDGLDGTRRIPRFCAGWHVRWNSRAGVSLSRDRQPPDRFYDWGCDGKDTANGRLAFIVPLGRQISR